MVDVSTHAIHPRTVHNIHTQCKVQNIHAVQSAKYQRKVCFKDQTRSCSWQVCHWHKNATRAEETYASFCHQGQWWGDARHPPATH